MRLMSLRVENLLTFSTFSLSLDGESRVIVGPNAAGKSHIIRVIDLVLNALDSVSEGVGSPRYRAAGEVLRSFAAARHHGDPPSRDTVVRLAVQLTTDAELSQFNAFFRAAVLHTLIQELSTGNNELRPALAEWVEQEITDERLTPLHSGVIVLRQAGMPQVPWEIGYEFSLDGHRVLWMLACPGFPRGIVRADSAAVRPATTSPESLAQVLLGIPQTGTDRGQTPVPLPGFDLARMCPKPGAAVAEPVIHFGTGIVDQQYPAFRQAIELLGLPVPEAGGQRTFPLGHVMSKLANDGVIVVGEQLRGLGTGGTPPVQPGPYAWDALASPSRSRAPWQLPLRLFDMKNGSPEERARFRAVQEVFTRLVPGRSVDVKFQAASAESVNPGAIAAGQVALQGLARGTDEVSQPYPMAFITVVIDRPADGGMHPDDLPIQMHGAGTWEALVIAEALADAAGRLVILDEPAVTLHPTWQRALRSLISTTPGQFLVITHAADLVPMDNADDLARLTRIENESGHSRAHSFEMASLAAYDITRITREFALSTDAVSLLFARAVVLLEGETELGALPAWFRRCSADIGCQPPGDLDLGFWSVGGDTNFRTYLAVLQSLAIPWALVCDGAAFDVQTRKTRSHIFDQVIKAGAEAPELRQFMNDLDTGERNRTMDPQMFADERDLAARSGIFTLALGWKTADKTAKTPGDESFEAYLNAAAPGKLDQAKTEAGDSKVRRGRWLGTEVECPAEVVALYPQLLAALRQRGLASC